MNEALDPETKRIIERFNNRSTAAVRVLAIWVPALVLLWLSGLEPRFSASTSYVTTKANYFRDAERMDTRKKVLAEYDDTQLDERLKDRIELLKTRKDELRTVAEVPFQLPGGINVPVPVVWAPTLWVFLAFGTLIFLLNQRSVLSGLSARAANSLAKNPEMAPLLHESLADAPFWLAPVPRKAGLAATPETHAAILGWRNDHLQIGLCAFFYMVLLAIQFRVAIFGLTLTDTFGSGHERWLAPFLSFVFCFSTLATIANVFMPRTLADSSPLETMGWSTSRRRFLTGAITGTLALSLLIISSRLPITVLTRSPRFRLRTHPRSEVLAIQSRGLHLNKHTRIAHYILDSGQILGVSHINVERLVPLKFTDLKLPPYIPHVHMSRTSATFELTALKYVKTEDYKSACEALKTGIEYDSIVLTNVNKGPDFRLYDLLAGLAVRYELPTYLKDLSAQLSNNKTSQTTSRHRTALGDRLKKWQNPKNKWHAKWADKSKKIVWCALPMQDTRSAGNGRSSRPHTTPFRVSI